MPSARTAEAEPTVPRDPRDAIPAIIERGVRDRFATVSIRALRSFQATISGRPGTPVDVGETVTLAWRDAVQAIDAGWAEEVNRA